MGRGRQHKRIQAPEPYCLSLDVSGPFKPGVGQFTKAPRYMLVGTYTVPADASANALVAGIHELGGMQTPADEALNRVFPEPNGSSEEPVVGPSALPSEPPAVHPEEGHLQEDQADQAVPLTAAEVTRCDAPDQRWKEHITAAIM